MKSHKNQVFLKMVRAKLTETWEGGGFGGENLQNEFINQGEPLQPPWGIGLTCVQSVGIGIFHQSGES